MTNTMTNTFSVIKTGGKQYIAVSGQKLRIEKLEGEHKAGDTISFDEVLMTSVAGKVEIGTPMIAKASVKAKIVEITRDPTILVVKYRAKSRYHKKNGHRQPKFIVEII
jgi:large subunit ribosomal protein L21